MKVLFLDIDGVITHHEFVKNGGSWRTADPECLFLLRKIIDETNCKIVISASIRKTKSLDEICEMYGFDRDWVIDRTPGSSNGYRGGEIKEWLDLNSHLDIESIVILDDSSDIDPLKKFWVCINGRYKRGINITEALEAIIILKSNMYKEFR